MTHLIEELRVELAFRTEREALHGQAPWDALLRERLLAVAEEVFDETSTPGEILRFERLSVDLGVADPETDPAELERRMKHRLRLAIQEGLRRPPDGARDRAHVVTRAYSDLELVTSFLVSGRLPWHGGRGASGGLEELIRRTLEARGPAFARWLRGVAGRPEIVHRLARQLPEDALEHVAVMLAPERGPLIGALARLLRSLFDTAVTGAGTGAPAGRLVWEALIVTALEHDPAARDDVWFARQAIKRSARLRGGNNSATAAALRDAVARLKAMVEPAVDVAGAFRVMRRATIPDEAAVAVGNEITRPASWKWRRLHARLGRAIETGDARTVAADWRALVAEHGALLTATVKFHGRLAAVRHRLAEGFPEPLLLDVVRLLEPLHGEFIREVVGSSVAFPDGNPDPAAQPEARRRRMWEFTLTYLLVERGGTFNKRSYLGSVIGQMAARDNVAYDAVLAMLVAGLDGAGARSALQTEMLGHLLGLGRDAGTHPDTGFEYQVASQDVLEAVCAYDELAARLGLYRGRPGGRGAVVAILERLAARYPWQFVRLASELKAGAGSLARIAARLSAPELRSLVLAVVAGVRAGALPAGREFADALDDHASRARDEREYFAHVLARVLEGKPVDLEAIAGGREGPAPLPTPLRLDEPAAPASAGSLRRAQVEAWISGGRMDLLAPVWAELVRERPALLRGVIRDHCRFAGMRRALVAHLDEAMLGDAVRLLASQQAGFICEIVQRPGLFQGAAGQPVADGAGLKRRLWDFTLSYLVVERGGRFNKRDYVGSLVRQMAAHDNLAFAALLHAIIATLGQLPRLGALELEMLALLRELVQEPARAQSAATRPVPPRRASAARAGVASGRAPDSGAGASEEEPVDLTAVAGALNFRRKPDAAGRRRLVEGIRQALARAPRELERVLARALEKPLAIARLVDLLPEGELTRVLMLHRPQPAALALRCADLIATTALWVHAGGKSAPASSTAGEAGAGAARVPVSRVTPAQMVRWKWRFILDELVAQGRPFDVARFAAALVAHLAKMVRAADLRHLRDDIARSLAERATSADRALARAIADALAPPDLAANGGSARDVPDAAAHEAPGVPLGALYVINAGQVLAAPYLPQLFGMLGLTVDGRFENAAAAERAIHLLQFMVDGSAGTPEHLLTLNKILCGVPVDAPIERDIVLTEEERNAVLGMIQGMIRNWKAIGSTSIAGMRESFFQREGRLQLKGDAWHLLVEPRAFDMLLDRIPWGYSTIRHPWMDRVVHVEWR